MSATVNLAELGGSPTRAKLHFDFTATPFNPVLLPYDLTRGGSAYPYVGHADIKELAIYLQDQIKAGSWIFNLGIRGDMYNGLAISVSRNLVWQWPIVSSQQILCSVCRTPGHWKLHSTKTWCCPARVAGALFFHHCSTACPRYPPLCSQVFVTKNSINRNT
jgi:hypothetical protein